MDLSELKGIISLMQKSDLTELEIETQDLKLRMGRPGAGAVVTHSVSPLIAPQPASSASVQPAAEQASADAVNNFKSPMVGTFYRKPSPDDAAFVQVGDHVNKGDILCIIEAMKVMNEIQADISGEITEIFAEDGDSVEYGQPLFSIK